MNATGITLDLSVNLTSIMAMAIALITFVTAFNRLTSKIDLNTVAMDAKFTIVETRLSSVEVTLRDSKSFNERLAVIEVRQNTQATDIHDLRMGKGWIIDPKDH